MKSLAGLYQKETKFFKLVSLVGTEFAAYFGSFKFEKSTHMILIFKSMYYSHKIDLFLFITITYRCKETVIYFLCAAYHDLLV